MGVIYTDYSGIITGENKDPHAIVLAAVVVKDSLNSKLIERENELINSLEKQNFKFWPKFEFKAHTMFSALNKRGSKTRWLQLEPPKIENVLNKIKVTILELRLPTVIVLINMRENWESGLSNLGKTRNNIITHLDDTTKMTIENDLNKYKKNQRIKAEPFKNVISLFFGLINGIIYERKITEQYNTIVDKQFVKQVEPWGIMFSELITHGESLVQLSLPVFGVNRNYKPGWYLSGSVEEKESQDYFGLQLADHVAYITRRNWIKPEENIKRLSVFKETEIVPFNFKYMRYPGIYAGICNYDTFNRGSMLKPWKKK